MPKKLKILMPMLEAGAGHKMPANAVKDAIEEQYPGKYQIDVIDFVKEIGELKTDKFFKEFWDFSLAHPIFARITFIIGQLFHPITRLYLPLFFPRVIRKLQSYLEKYKPDLIFATHYFALQASRIARDRIKIPAKVVGFITDPFQAYSWWREREADYILVASEKAKKKACGLWWIKKDKVKVFDFPINNKFFNIKRSSKAIQKEYSIDTSMTTILTSAGGQGIGKISCYVEDMYRKGMPFNILSVCGRNDELKSYYEKLIKSTKSKTNLIPLGYVSNMNELLSISDLCIAKAGASTTFEALHMKAPLIFTDWANQAEKPNIDYTVENQVGWYTPNDRIFWRVIDEILNTDILSGHRKRIENMKLKSGATDIGKFLIDLI